GRDDLARGIADLDRCLALAPRHVTALLYRASLHLKSAALEQDAAAQQACYDRALADCQAALALDPRSGISHYLQALLWSIRSAEPGLASAQVAARKGRALD